MTLQIRKRTLQSLTLATMMMVYATHGRAETEGGSSATGDSQAAATAELEQTVEEQARRIEELDSALGTIRERLDRDDEDSARVGSDAIGDGDASVTVGPEYVDARIEDFENAPTSRFMLSGYGTTGLVDVQNGRYARLPWAGVVRVVSESI